MALLYGSVEFTGRAYAQDDTDPDGLPTLVPLRGYVDFVPGRRTTYDTESGELVVLETIVAGIDENGRLRDGNGNPTVQLVAANSPDLMHRDWPYHAYLRLIGEERQGPFSFVLASGETVDVAQVIAAGGG